MEIRAGLVPMCTAKWLLGSAGNALGGTVHAGAGAVLVPEERVGGASPSGAAFFVRHGEALEIRANDVTSKVTSIQIGSEKPSTSVNRPKPCLMFLLVLFSQSRHVMVVFIQNSFQHCHNDMRCFSTPMFDHEHTTQVAVSTSETTEKQSETANTTI